MKTPTIKGSLVMLFGLLVAGLVGAADSGSKPFTVVMLPDTQNYVDFTRQKSAGFALDGKDLYLQQMAHIAGKGIANGGDVVFVAAVGDVWQHLVSDTDQEHVDRGIRSLGAGASFSALITPDETRNFEIPTAVEGYRLLSAAGIPFGVPPGNHDYDAWWSAPVAGTFAVDASAATLAALPPENVQTHLGGLEGFKGAFGSDSEFFRGKDWYVSGFNGGTSSAQVFSAGGYRFLHLAFEMHAGDQVLAWAAQVLNDNPGLPTIISTHDFLSKQGERRPTATMDLARVDPGYNNNAETIWQKFISQHDQILLVLSGHQAGQGLRIDTNIFGHKVYQMLADYQARGQAALDAGQSAGTTGTSPDLGDGWYRELTFHLESDVPSLAVKTYSTYYNSYASDLPTYVQWYKPDEQPDMTDAEFLEAEEFTLELDNFRARFGEPGE